MKVETRFSEEIMLHQSSANHDAAKVVAVLNSFLPGVTRSKNPECGWHLRQDQP